MNRIILFMTGMVLPALLHAQASDWEGGAVDGENIADVAAGGGRLFFALIAGILLAYAFQWILTCLSAATGMSILGKSTRNLRHKAHTGQFRRHDDGERSWRAEKDADKEGGWEKPVMKIQAGAGAWIVATSSIAVFCAAWLASEMIRFGGRTEAVILGLTVWAGYMATMMWLEATMLWSLLGNLTGAFKAGLKAAAAPFKAAAGPIANAASSSAEEVAAKVREEFRAQGGAGGMKDKLKDYVGGMKDRSLDRSQLESDADRLFEDSEVRQSVIQSGRTPSRSKFQEIAAGRSDLSQEEQRIITEVLYDRWNRTASSGRSEPSWSGGPAYAGSEAADAGTAGRSAEDRYAETREAPSAHAALGEEASLRGEPGTRRSGTSPYAPAGSGSPSGSPLSAEPVASRTVVRGDITARIQAFKDFLRKADKHDLNPVRIEQEVEAIIYNPEEGYARMERGVRDMRREEMAQALRQRRDITLDESDSIADLIDAARTRILSRSEIREHRAQETSDKALARVHDFVYSLRRPALDMDGFKSDFGKMLEDPKGGLDSLKSHAGSIKKEDMIEMFAARKGISREEAQQMADQAEHSLKAAEENARRIEEETRRRLEQAEVTAAEQAEATRKVAASAAWWLFGVSACTALAAALGGLLGAAT